LINYNAIKYAYAGTTVSVCVSREETALVVDVVSIGVPIRQEEKERIFWDRVRGAQAELYDPVGTGQGLYLARKIMRALGGDVTLDRSEEARGHRPLVVRPALTLVRLLKVSNLFFK